MQDNLRYVNCNICNADDFTVIFPENKGQIHRIVKCNQCGLMYANPQTTGEIEGKNSLDDLDEETKDNAEILDELSSFTREKNQYLNKQYIQVKDHKPVLDFLEAFPKDNILDVGAYSGNFLNEARIRGWEVIGLEPLAVPALYAEREFGLTIIRKPLERANLLPGSFKAITSFHVIEHIYDPENFIREIHTHLKPGGIMILETPTYDSLTFKILKHRERSIRCNGHIYFFTRKTLKALVEKCGFDVLKHDRVGRTLTLDRLFTNIGIMLGNRNVFNKLSGFLKLENRTIHLNTGDMQRIYCRKK